MSQITLENREAGEAEAEEVSVGETRAPLLFCHCHFPRCGDKDSLAGYDEEEEVGVGGRGGTLLGWTLNFCAGRHVKGVLLPPSWRGEPK